MTNESDRDDGRGSHRRGDNRRGGDVDRKRNSAASFGAAADAYFESAVHGEGADLDHLAQWCDGATRVLDVACGAGHTARAVARRGVSLDGERVRSRVVAADAAPEMVRTTIDAFGVPGIVADAEQLPFSEHAFDAVTCRIAAHHFPNPTAFIDEVTRVLRPGGTFAFEDNVAPTDAELGSFLNRLERRRDPTHVESHPTRRWIEWLEAAGFDVRETVHLKKTIDFENWIETQSLSKEERSAVEHLLLDAPPGARSLFEIRIEDGSVRSFANLKALIRAVRID